MYRENGSALQEQIGANVLLVDWRRGAAAPVYSVAASNTPAVGAELSVVLQRLMRNNSNLMPHDVHIIGFSLGAHVAGFCGRHFLMHTRKRIGRITALDPAGPLFEGTNVSVSRGDADFVDVIHTNMGQLEHLQFGLAASVGDVDFFPNGGSEQPGCHRIACSHQRAHELMIESITNQHCMFTSQPVNSQRDLIAKKINLSSKSLHESGSTGQGAMGYYSISAKGRGIQYIRTRSKPPFCIRE
nr:putative endothelial lipase [Rhipicephalus microplus]